MDNRKTRAVSEDFATLANRIADDEDLTFDVVIVGSGYGAAVAAATFADKKVGDDGDPVSVAVLERGNEYLPGMFPRNLSELPVHARYSLPSGSRNKAGLYDIRPSADASAIVANGLGGGSLINAGVMEPPLPEVINDPRWPFDYNQDFEDALNDAKAALGAELYTGLNGGVAPPKQQALQNLDSANFRAAHITVAQEDGETPAGVGLNACIQCGDCVTGCNHNAKKSLDTNLLAQASRYDNVKIYTGATVLDLERKGDLWVLNTVFTHEQLRKRHDAAVQVKATRVVLAAGTFGSTEILQRSKRSDDRPNGLGLSDQLGRNASTNGDNMIVHYETDDVINAIADEAVRPSEREIGPTITGVLDLRDTPDRLVIEEMAVPAGLRWIFQELFATANTMHGLNKADCSLHWWGHPNKDDYALENDTLSKTSLYAVMGHDAPGIPGNGISLENGGEPVDLHHDGYLRMKSQFISDHPVFSAGLRVLEDLGEGTGGRTIANPAWQPLPEGLQWLVDYGHGPVLTVHPLGGCNMAGNVGGGVVDQYGRVFDPGNDLHDGLAVLDGSILPTAVGINPALTITAVAMRGAEKLAEDWGFVEEAQEVAEPPERVRYQEADVVFPVAPTKITVHERLDGGVRFRPQGNEEADYHVQLTLRFEPFEVQHFFRRKSPEHKPTLTLDQTGSFIRVFETADWDALPGQNLSDWRLERRLDEIAVFRAPLEGTFGVFERGLSWSWCRAVRAGLAYLWNRLIRETLVKRDLPAQPPNPQAPPDPSGWEKFKTGLRMATHAGEHRRLVYRLRVGDPDPGVVNILALRGRRLKGVKLFTYRCKANPWNQLSEIQLKRFPGMWCLGSGARKLVVDLGYFARRGIPLFQVTEQQDQTRAIADLVSFFAYLARLMLGVHLWSFRSPDPEPEGYGEEAQNQEIRRLPENHVSADVETTRVQLDVPDTEWINGERVEPLLTRYRHPETVNAEKPPILLIHGYSAGGTTFYHPRVDENAVDVFLAAGRDVWVLDMRTSPGLETAVQPWAFEDVALTDIPLAVAHVAQEAGGPVDVLAHCMGAVMFSMAVLEGDTKSGFLDAGDERRLARAALSDNLNKVAFTQVTPFVVFSPINVFRAFVARYLIDFLPVDGYQFRPEDPHPVGTNFMDRILSTLPYPEEDFLYENPPPLRFSNQWPFIHLERSNTFWTRTRHRMDALYGRDFNAPNISRDVLARIDDLFGPLNIRTVTQTIHFARFKTIANREGRNEYITRDNSNLRWNFELLTVHGDENGLADVSTAARTADVLGGGLNRHHKPYIVKGAGHQDALIGDTSEQVFGVIRDFFDADPEEEKGDAMENLVAYPPWIGPILTRHEVEDGEWNQGYRIRLGTRPMLDAARGVVLYKTDDYDPAAGTVDPVPAEAELAGATYLAANAQMAIDDWIVIELPEETVPNPELGEVLIVLVIFDAPDGFVTLALQDALPGILGTVVFGPGPNQTGTLFAGPPLDPTLPPPIIREAAWLRIGAAVHSMLQGELARGPGPGGHQSDGGGLEQVPTGIFRRAPVPPEVIAPRIVPGPSSQTMPLPRGQMSERDLSMEAVVEALEEPVPRLPDGVVTLSPLDDTARFAFGSCQFPENLLDAPVAYTGYADLVRRLEGPEDGEIQPNFVVLTGDQVYVDVLAGIYDPVTLDSRFDRPYFRWLRSQPVRHALRRVPSWMLPDDHEFDDNWEKISPVHVELDETNEAYMQEGSQSYFKYQRSEVLPGIHPVSQHFTWPPTNPDGVPFFLLDTRAGRESRQVTTYGSRALINNFGNVITWLQDHADEPKFIVTPSVLLPRHLRVATNEPEEAIYSDGWDGYPMSMNGLLRFIANHEIQRTVFLSGDEHMACNAEISLRRSGGGELAKVWSLHTPGIHAPFDFAQGQRAKFRDEEMFEIAPDIECHVDADYPDAQNSFTYLVLEQRLQGWVLSWQYRGDDGDEFVLG